MVGMFECDVFESFEGFDVAVADDLDLRLGGDGLEVGVEDTSFVDGLSMAVGVCGWVEASGQFVLGFGR